MRLNPCKLKSLAESRREFRASDLMPHYTWLFISKVLGFFECPKEPKCHILFLKEVCSRAGAAQPLLCYCKRSSAFFNANNSGRTLCTRMLRNLVPKKVRETKFRDFDMQPSGPCPETENGVTQPL